MSNLESITDKLVKHLRDNTLNLIDDEAIHDLAKQAVDRAFFKDIQYDTYRTREAPAITAAKEIAKQAADKIVKETVDKLKDNPQFQEAVNKAIADAFCLAINQYAMDSVQDMLRQNIHRSYDVLRQSIQAAGGDINLLPPTVNV